MIDYQQKMNPAILEIAPPGIRKFFDIANEMQDVISLSIGEPDFVTPWHVRQEGIRSLEDGKTWYSPNRGFSELRNELSAWFHRHYGVEYNPDKELLITVGGSEAIDLCFRTLLCLLRSAGQHGGRRTGVHRDEGRELFSSHSGGN